MMIIVKNTYPKDGIGLHEIGTLCQWVIESGRLSLVKCDTAGKCLPSKIEKTNGVPQDINHIFTHGKVYALNGNLLSGKTEPPKIGVVAKYVKNGWYLEVEDVNNQ